MLKKIASMLLLVMIIAACGDMKATTAPGQPPVSGDSIVVSLAFSPEKETWLTERFAAFNGQQIQVNGKTVVVEGKVVSSGQARTDIKTGALQTVVWSPSASTWLEVLKQESGNQNIAEPNAQPLVLTPVVISMWKPMAEALGWPDKPVGWRDLLALINDPDGWGKYGHSEWGRFSWGHTDPEISTSALSTVLAELYAATNKTSGLTAEDVRAEASQKFLRDLAQGIKHYGYNTLVFSENMQKYGLTYISAFPMEEITLIDFNKKGPVTPLVAIYPAEGTFTHDNPFIVMSSASADQKAAAAKLYEFLQSEESQQKAMAFGFRPANINVALGDPLTMQYGVDPRQPRQSLDLPSADVIVAAKDAWANNRKPANIMIVVDTSGSMRGEKMDQAKAGVDYFLSRLPAQDNVGLIGFDNEPRVLVPLDVRAENMSNLQAQIQGMIPEGKTSLYDAIDMARLELDKLNQPDRINAIVVLSDGADTASMMTIEQMEQNFGETSIPIFPIAYGEDAETTVLQRIADFARTQLVKGGTDDINKIFENLSRYF
jgi:Ca-activated chloride channel homolog